MRRLIILLAMSVVIVVLSGWSLCEDWAPAMQFVTIGDWGELGPALYTTAAAVVSYANDPQTQFVAMVGDNFYPGGLSGPDDPSFKDIFEDPFEASRCVFHPILGDNDYGDKQKFGSLSAQVLVSEKNPKWDMPGLYYKRRLDINGVSLCAVFIDTQSLIEITHASDRTPDELHVLSEQLVWLRASLSSSWCRESDFVVVFGHHAVKSGGKKARKGPAKKVAEILIPIFEESKIDAYHAGHDHDLQLIKKDIPEESCDGATVHCMSFVVSGAASRLREHPQVLDIEGFTRWGNVNTIGFAVTRVSKTYLETSMVASETGEVLHSDRTPSHRSMRVGGIRIL